MPKNVKGAFSKSSLLQNLKKIEGAPFGNIEKFSKKKQKMRNLKSHRADKCKRGTLWTFSTPIHLQNNKKIKGGPFENIENFSKNGK